MTLFRVIACYVVVSRICLCTHFVLLLLLNEFMLSWDMPPPLCSFCLSASQLKLQDQFKICFGPYTVGNFLYSFIIMHAASHLACFAVWIVSFAFWLVSFAHNICELLDRLISTVIFCMTTTWVCLCAILQYTQWVPVSCLYICIYISLPGSHNFPVSPVCSLRVSSACANSGSLYPAAVYLFCWESVVDLCPKTFYRESKVFLVSFSVKT